MKKVRDRYSEDFINKITEDFLSGGMANYDVNRIRRKIQNLREENKDAIFLEMHFAVISVMLEDAVDALNGIAQVAELDAQIADCVAAESVLTDKIIAYLELRPSKVASIGGNAKAKKYERLKEETIRLYKDGKWKSAPRAAMDITPKIVAMSKGGNGDLLPTTTKPLEWIREFRREMMVPAKQSLHLTKQNEQDA